MTPALGQTLKGQSPELGPVAEYIRGYLHARDAQLGGMEVGVVDHETAEGAIQLYLTGVHRRAKHEGDDPTEAYCNGVHDGVKLWMSKQDAIPFETRGVLESLTKTRLSNILRAEVFREIDADIVPGSTTRLRKMVLIHAARILGHEADTGLNRADICEQLSLAMGYEIEPGRNWSSGLRRCEVLDIVEKLLDRDDN